MDLLRHSERWWLAGKGEFGARVVKTERVADILKARGYLVVEVVPASQLAGAVEALQAILAASDTSQPVESPINRLCGVHEEARLALDRLGGQ